MVPPTTMTTKTWYPILVHLPMGLGPFFSSSSSPWDVFVEKTYLHKEPTRSKMAVFSKKYGKYYKMRTET